MDKNRVELHIRDIIKHLLRPLAEFFFALSCIRQLIAAYPHGANLIGLRSVNGRSFRCAIARLFRKFCGSPGA